MPLIAELPNHELASRPSWIPRMCYSKPSHSGSVVNWTSHHPRSLLINISKNEFRRAIRNSSNKHAEKKLSIHIILQRFQDNAYPHRIFKDALRSVRRNDCRRRENLQKKHYLVLPFLSEKQTLNIKCTLFRTGLNDFLTVSLQYNLLSSILKPKQCSLHSMQHVFQFFHRRNEAGHAYMSERAYEPNTSLVFRHLAQLNTVPHISLITWKILHRAIVNTNLRRHIELCEIRDRQPDIQYNVNVQNTQVDSSFFLTSFSFTSHLTKPMAKICAYFIFWIVYFRSRTNLSFLNYCPYYRYYH